MKPTTLIAFVFATCAAPVFADGHATGNAEDGQSLFKKCKACHAVVGADDDVIVKGGNNGPNLYGIYTRVAGADENFKKFGKSLIAAGEAGLAWNEDDFVAYIADPKKFLKTYLDDKKAKSKMSYKLKDEQDAKDIWAFLVSVGPVVESETTETATD